MHTALNGADGLAAMTHGIQYCVIVVDMGMPGMDGIEFLSHARKLSPQTVFAMLTGNADQQTAVRALNEGRVHRFLNKPCSTSMVVETITACIAHFRGNEEPEPKIALVDAPQEPPEDDHAQSAAHQLREAAEKGIAAAQFNLGVLYASGTGVPKDAVKAVEWYRKAALQGFPQAQFNLSLAYEEGHGVLRDDTEAYAWMNLATVKLREAAKLRNAMEDAMPPTQLPAGQARARELAAQIQARARWGWSREMR